MMRFAILVLTYLAYLSADGAELIPYTAEYRAQFETGVAIKGKAVRKLVQAKDGSWEYHFNVDSFIADIRESVRFDWQDDHIVPEDYRYSLSGFWIKDRYARVDFDWQAMQVRNEVKNKPWYMDVPHGALDKLGYQLQLQMDLSMGKREMRYQVADGGKLKDFPFKVLGSEVLDTPFGKAEALIVEKVRAPEKKRHTKMWFAKNWQYLLVKMQHVESDGERYEIKLNKAQIGDLKLGY